MKPGAFGSSGIARTSRAGASAERRGDRCRRRRRPRANRTRGLVRPRRKRRRRAVPISAPFSNCDPPNAVWCIDCKGTCRMRDGRWCHVLTLIDAYSRFLLRREAVLDPDGTPRAHQPGTSRTESPPRAHAPQPKSARRHRRARLPCSRHRRIQPPRHRWVALRAQAAPVARTLERSFDKYGPDAIRPARRASLGAAYSTRMTSRTRRRHPRPRWRILARSCSSRSARPSARSTLQPASVISS